MAMLESLLIKLFFALGDRLITEGSEYFQNWLDLKEAVEKARKYKEVVDKPGNTREERRKAEDELMG